MGKRRLYRIDPEDIEYHWFGHRLKMSGVVYQGEEDTYILMFPTGLEFEYGDAVWLSWGQWMSVIEATDQPQYEDVMKILRKKQEAAVSGGVQWAVFERDGYTCMFCGKVGGRNAPLTVDHFIPLEDGGPNEMSNYLTACRRCNKRKGSMSPERYCREEGLDYKGLEKYLTGNFPRTFIEHLTD